MTGGILQTKAGFFVDLFFLVLLVLLPAILVAVALVRRGHVKAHATINTTCFVLFLVAVIAFEAQVHFGPKGPPLATLPLVIHLCCAVPCLLLWVRQMLTAKRALTQPAVHRRRGRILVALLGLTVGTGAWLYWATFV